MFWRKSRICGLLSNPVCIHYISSDGNLGFLSVFGTKHNYNCVTKCEFAKDLVRISVLEENLNLQSNLQLAAQEAKIQSLFIRQCFLFFVFGYETQNY